MRNNVKLTDSLHSSNSAKNMIIIMWSNLDFNPLWRLIIEKKNIYIVNVVHLCVSWKLTWFGIHAWCFESEKNITITKEKPKKKKEEVRYVFGIKTRLPLNPFFATKNHDLPTEIRQTSDFRFGLNMNIVHCKWCVYILFVYFFYYIYNKASMTVLAGYLDIAYAMQHIKNIHYF